MTLCKPVLQLSTPVVPESRINDSMTVYEEDHQNYKLDSNETPVRYPGVQKHGLWYIGSA